ncbi:unnamed protein product [Ambrosiozyma monospora]|uniref:Unnamed protein product n=1 Tax=Ambrosiozyma monospora TaxID=43982 RepID=A0ACB5TUY4_AMBMO|nr:unnamed protein product [Ambrosiozyma monospora]
MDYFAEMVKTDEHMDKMKSKLIKEQTEKKAREEARRQRQLKKFGKQVQNETLIKRQKEKRETLDKINSLKKKRKMNEIGGDAFDVGIEEAASSGDGFNKRQKRGNDKGRGKGPIVNQKPTKKRLGRNRRRNKRK